MRPQIWLTTVVAIAIVAAGLAAGWAVLRPAGPALVSANLSESSISPNADSDKDVTQVDYVLRRPATVSIYFENPAGTRFYFRQEGAREAGQHHVDFAGVVDGYMLPGEVVSGTVAARVLQDGAYTWVISARDEAKKSNLISGTLTVEQADAHLPQLGISVSPSVFTPNQDGLSDRALINVWLDKDTDPDGLRVVLVGPDNAALPIGELPGAVPYGGRGLHAFDYDGGIDLGAEPPPDGTYTVKAEAEDAVGQRVTTTAELTIQDGGLPRADILFGIVDWSRTAVPVGDTLFFTLTVENYGTAPLRTSGPWSGWTYASMSTNANTLGHYEESGAWRVGVNCQTCASDYPWRWALGTPETLTVIRDEAGRDQYYLLPGLRAIITGGIALDNVVPSRNPQYFWAGLIHEDVEVAPINSRVGPASVTILVP